MSNNIDFIQLLDLNLDALIQPIKTQVNAPNKGSNKSYIIVLVVFAIILVFCVVLFSYYEQNRKEELE